MVGVGGGSDGVIKHILHVPWAVLKSRQWLSVSLATSSAPVLLSSHYNNNSNTVNAVNMGNSPPPPNSKCYRITGT